MYITFEHIFFASCGRHPLNLKIVYIQYDTMIPQRTRIIVGDAGIEPGTTAPQKSIELPMNEPPHLQRKICVHLYSILTRTLVKKKKINSKVI